MCEQNKAKGREKREERKERREKLTERREKLTKRREKLTRRREKRGEATMALLCKEPWRYLYDGNGQREVQSGTSLVCSRTKRWSKKKSVGQLPLGQFILFQAHSLSSFESPSVVWVSPPSILSLPCLPLRPPLPRHCPRLFLSTSTQAVSLALNFAGATALRDTRLSILFYASSPKGQSRPRLSCVR